MTDRELLERAALAAGLVEYEYYADDHGQWECMAFDPGGSKSEYWNPLTDDGDALRLAVKLNLTTVFHPVLNQALCRPYWTTAMDAESREDAEKHADPYAATRRCIVRAAASIGPAEPIQKELM